MLRLLSAALVLLAPLAALTPYHAAAQPTYCRVALIVDYTYGVSYRALLRMAPECGVETVGRVRKVTAGGGQIPGGLERYGRLWGWNMDRTTTLVPQDQRWSLYNTRWQWWDGRIWQRVGPP